MILRAPFMISSRLLPAVKVGGATISLEPIGRTSDNRPRWRYFIDINPPFPGYAGGYLADDLYGDVGGLHDTQDAMAALLSFLGAAAEAYAYQISTGRESDNADLFPACIEEWATQYSDELSMLQCELEENKGLIVE